MFTKEDILARLQNGDSMDKIAKEMSDTLNAAQQQYQEETIKANAEKLEAERVMNAKRVAVDTILDGMCDYLVAAGKDKLIEDMKDIDTDDVIDMLDSVIEMSETLEKLKNLEFAGLKLPTVEHKCGSGDCSNNKPEAFTVKAKVNPDADAIIKAFLRNL